VSDDLTVHVNRRQRHDVEVAGAPVEAEGSFEVVLKNHGAGSHVHLGLDGDLAAAATVEEPTPFLDADATRTVPVSVGPARPITGALTVATGYGQTTMDVPVSVVESTGPAVDARPASDDAATLGPLADLLAVVGGDAAADNVALVALAAVALFVALLAAALVDSAVVLGGVLFVVAAVVGALGLLARE
jgi:hypothetical protein